MRLQRLCATDYAHFIKNYYPAQICVNTTDDVIERFERAPKMPEQKHGEAEGGMLPGHEVEALLLSAPEPRLRFWNPLDVADLAWSELLKKLSAVGAYEAACERAKKRVKTT